jgi:di/tricarboxylate transporter
VGLARGNESALIGIVMSTAAALSAIMVNIGTAAVLLPAVMSASRKTKISPSRLIFPLGMGTIIGGMITLIGATPTIIMNEFLGSASLEQYKIFEQAPLVLPAVVVGVIVMVVLKNVLLPTKEPEYEDIIERSGALIRTYQLDHVLHEVIVKQDSQLAGKTLRDCGLRARHGIYVLGVRRDGDFQPPPTADTVLLPGDRLLIRATDDALDHAKEPCGLEVLPEVENFPPTLLREGFQMAEVALAPRSLLQGKTVAEADFYNRYGLRIFAIDHRGKPKHVHLADHKLDFGDALLVHGRPDRIEALEEDPNFIVLEKATPEEEPKIDLTAAVVTVTVTVLTLGAVALHILPLGAASVGGATLLLLLGVMTMEEAYRSISWKVLIFIGGMLPMGAAMMHSGTSDMVGRMLSGVLGGHSIFWLYLLVAVVAALVGHLTSNVTAAVVTIPLAIQTAMQLGVDPRPAALVAPRRCRSRPSSSAGTVLSCIRQ